jgi:hypothetical protein
MFSGSNLNPFENHAGLLVTWQDKWTKRWHVEPPSVPSLPDGLQSKVVQQHLANFQLWHAEDSARAPEATDQDLASIKRFIDQTNQRRNDLAEQCDALLLAELAQKNLPNPQSEIHSESPGLMIDRLSILSLKLFHTEEEIARTDAATAHKVRNQERLRLLTEQRSDLAGALGRLWEQVLQGQRRFKIYRQLKMYNDPTLNPAVYGARPADSSS